MKTNCAHCGAELSRPPRRLKANPNQFCDHACHTAFQRRRRTEAVCSVCGTAIDRPPSVLAKSKTLACSEPCRRISISRSHVEVRGTAETRQATCAQCGKEFTRKPSQLAKYGQSFCSQACRFGREPVSPTTVPAEYAPRKRQSFPELRTGRWEPCEMCGEPVWCFKSRQWKHVFCGRSCGDAWKMQRNGSAHPLWQGGSTDYAPGFNSAIKKVIRKRDGNLCQICQRPPAGTRAHHVHHIDDDKTNHAPSNLVTLCFGCHGKIHHGRVSLPDGIPVMLT